MIHAPLLAIFFLLSPIAVLASQWHDPADIARTAEEFASAETRQLPGRAKVDPARIDPRLRLPRCARPVAFLPSGQRFPGAASIGVRCDSPPWTVFVPLRVRLMTPTVVSKVPLSRGEAVSAAQLALVEEDAGALPQGSLHRIDDAVGRVPIVGLPAGTVLKSGELRAPIVVRNGTVVRVLYMSGNLQVSNEGRALGDATAGQTVAVRVQSGRVVIGIAAADGTVLVR